MIYHRYIREDRDGRKGVFKMEQLTYTTLGEWQGYLLRQAPERVLQFGEGNFLRGFADHFIDVMNERAGFNG